MKKTYVLIISLILGICYQVKAQNETFAELADLTHLQLDSEFKLSISSYNYYTEENVSGNSNFHYWWNAHVVDILIDAYIRTNDNSYKQKVTSLVNGMKEKNGGTFENEFNDDMEWLSLALLRAFQKTNDNFFLDVSTSLWDKIKESENSNQGGGIAWKTTQLDYKNTPANAPAIIIAARRYKLWNHSWELELATRLYDWLKLTLVESNGRVNDGINRTGDGTIDYWQFTYNYGVFIGAALEMYNATNTVSYLNDAILTADYVVDNPELINGGVLKDEGNGDGALFKGILVRYLTLLIENQDVPVEKKQAYSQLLENCANTIYNFGINRTNYLIGTNWYYTPSETVELSALLSGMMMIEAAHRLNFTPQVFSVKPVPGIVQAEDYISAEGVITETTTDIGGGDNVGAIDSSDWMMYCLEISETGNYSIKLRVSSFSGGGQLIIKSNGQSIKTIDIPSTGGWQNWVTVNDVIYLPAGKQNIEIYAASGGFNFNWIEFELNTDEFTGFFEAEDYFSMYGIITETTTDVGGGQNVGAIDDGDWLDYKINVNTPGDYLLIARVSSFSGGGVLLVESNGQSLGQINIESTGDWQNWINANTSIYLTQGEHIIRMKAQTGGYNINWFELFVDITDLQGTISAQYSDSPSGEEIAKLIDNSESTKFLTFHNTAWVQFEANQSETLVGYALTSANDSPERDPLSWTLKGSTDGLNWETIDTQSEQDFPERFMKKIYVLNDTQSYQYYRMEMTNNSGNLLQLAEWNLFGRTSNCVNVESLKSTSITNTKIKDQDIDMHVYPNPVNSGESIFLVLGKDYQEVHVYIYDMYGRERYETMISNQINKIELELKGLEKGMYLAKIRSDGKLKVIKLLIH